MNGRLTFGHHPLLPHTPAHHLPVQDDIPDTGGKQAVEVRGQQPFAGGPPERSAEVFAVPGGCCSSSRPDNSRSCEFKYLVRHFSGDGGFLVV